MSQEARDVDDHAEPRSKSASATVIAAGAVVHGDIHASGDLVVRGRVEGHVAGAGVVFVVEGGVVHADIDAGAVHVRGEVVGDVVAVDLVELVGGGRVTGDVRAARVSIADGATLRGSVTLSPARSGDAATDRPSSSTNDARPAHAEQPAAAGVARAAGHLLGSDGGPPPARGLVEKTHKPRLYVRHAVDVARPRSP